MEHCGTAEPFAHVEFLQQLGQELTGTEPERVFPLAVSWDLAARRSETLAKGVVLVGHPPFCKLQVVAGGSVSLGLHPAAGSSADPGSPPWVGSTVGEVCASPPVACASPALRFQGIGDKLGKGFLNPGGLEGLAETSALLLDWGMKHAGWVSGLSSGGDLAPHSPLTHTRSHSVPTGPGSRGWLEAPNLRDHDQAPRGVPGDLR